MEHRPGDGESGSSSNPAAGGSSGDVLSDPPASENAGTTAGKGGVTDAPDAGAPGSSAGASGGGASASPALDRLDELEALWRAWNLSDYELLLSHYYTTVPERVFRISVRGGSVESAVAGPSRSVPTEPVPEQDYEPWFTIDGLFDMLREQIQSGSLDHVSGHRRLGFPSGITLEDEPYEKVWVSGVVDIQGEVFIELEAAREAWEAAPVRNYDMWVSQINYSFLNDPEYNVLVSVRDGEIISVLGAPAYRDPNEPIAPADYQLWYTVEGLFFQALLAIASDPDELDIRLDEELGFPKEIWVDPDYETFDDEDQFLVFEFVETDSLEP